MDRHELLLSPVAYMPPSRLLGGLTAEDAARRVLGATHSIVEILAHLVYWQSWFIARCGGTAVPMASTASAGWPAATAADWPMLRDQFLDGLQRAVALPDGRVDPPIEFAPLAHYTVADALTHLAVHNAHHLGQIVTLRQLLGVWPPPEGSWTW